MDKEDLIKVNELLMIFNNLRVCGKQDCTNILAGIERCESLLQKYSQNAM